MKRLVGSTRPTRYGAFSIDHLLAFVTMLVCGSMLSEYIPIPTTDMERLATGLVIYSFYLLYHFLFELLVGGTPGKLLLGLTVRQIDGSKCTAWPILVRTASRIVEANPIFLGGLPAALIVRYSSRHQRLGDMLGHTVVITTEEAKAIDRSLKKAAAEA